MATTQTGHISYRVVDANRVPATLPVYFKNTSGSLDDIQTFATTLATKLDGVIDSQITSIDVSIKTAIPSGLKSGPTTGTDNMIRALLTYYTAGPRASGLSVPNWKSNAFIAAHQGLVDTAQTTPNDVAGFLALLLAATASTNATDDQYNVLLGLTKAVKSDRKSRRGLARAR